MAIENKNEYIAIFEDDIYLSPSSSIFLSNSKWIPSDIDIVKLEKYSKYFSRYNCKKTRTLDNRVLYEVKKCNLGTAGYIINIETAKKILNRLSSKKNILAIDIELFTPTLNNDINCFMIEPAICIQDFIFNNSKATSFSSFIMPKKNSMNTKKTFLTKIKKEISRLSPLSAIKKHVLSKKSTYR